MIRNKNQYVTEFKENLRGGKGKIKVEHYWQQGQELLAENRLFAKLTIEPGDNIGYHLHENEEEVFIILSGIAEADDNGKIVILEAGDTILTGNGNGHSIKCISSEPLTLLAVISKYH
jgi:mannose-6-phosphate isomerase-like protein (cupin superfamily)